MKKRFYLLFLLLFAGIGIILAQTQVVGSVVDDKQEPVIGASILIKGTGQGTVTDFDGRFTLNVPTSSNVLVVSYVGMLTQEVAVKPILQIVLSSDTELLEEVVVVGYGTQRKENLTGAVSSIDVGKTLDSRPISDVGRGLQGTTAGLSIVNRNGEIGSDPQIKIRGQLASIEGGTSPLILLDNVEIPSIQMVNPDDIESISVLKDAASASIYGSKAAFGVILITTKKGAKTESVNIAYSNNFSWQNASKRIEMAGIDGLNYAMDAAERVNATFTGVFFKINRESIKKTEEWLQNYGHLGPNDPTVMGRDWYYTPGDKNKYGVRLYDPYDYMVKEWAPSQTHNLSVNGKTGGTSYNVGLGYLDQNGMLKPAKHDDFKRYNGSLRLVSDLNKYITLKAGAIYSKRQKRYAGSIDAQYDPWYYLYRWGPNYAYGDDENGNPLRGAVQETAQANSAVDTYNYTNVSIGATLNFTSNWTGDVDFTHANNEYIMDSPGVRYSAADSWGEPIVRRGEDGNQLFVNSDGQVVPSGTLNAMPAYDLNYWEYTSKGTGADNVYRRAENSIRNTLNAYTTYNLRLKELHNFKFMLGLNRVTFDEKSNWSKKTELVDITNPQFDLAIGTQTSGGKEFWEAQLGYYGRINYSFADKYLLEANLRYDGTSKFPSDLRWRSFPSFSAGWRISEEAFMDWSRSTLDQFKIRASWGTIGDQTVSNALYVPTMSTIITPWLSSGGKKQVSFYTPNAISPNITWQDITTLDFGLDLRMFKNRFGVVFDWYQRDTRNMIVPGTPVSETFGTGSPKGNFGNLRTQGWELSVDYNHRFDNGLGINLMATISDAITDITKYENSIKSTSEYSWYEGKRFGDLWGYSTDRLYQKDDFAYDNNGKLVETYALNGKEVAAGTVGAKKAYKLTDPNGVYQDFFQSGQFLFGPGDVKYKDVNKDGKIDNGNGTEDEPGDLSIIGNKSPRYEYGFRLGGDWKGFDFSIFFQGVGKRDIWGNGNLAIAGYNSSDGAMPQAIAEDYWKEDRTDAFYPRPWNLGSTNVGYNMQVQDRYLLNMAYLRLKNITVGYSLPMPVINQIGLTKTRFYVSLENLATFDKLRGLPIDPEIESSYNYFAYSNHNLGRTGMSSPVFKSVAIGVQLNF